MPDEMGGDWAEYRRLVISELESLHSSQTEINAKLDAIRADFGKAIGSIKDDQIAKIWAEIAVLKFKTGMIAAVAGSIPTAIAALIWLISKH